MQFVKRFVVASFILILGVSSAAAQSSPRTYCGCSLFDKSNSSPFYIDFLKSSDDSESVFLRLVNNTGCLVEVEASGGGMIAFPRAGATLVGNAARDRDGEMLAVSYYLQDAELKKSPQPRYERTNNIVTAQVQSGSSIVFSVPLTKFKKNQIMVPVEIKAGEVSSRSEVYFYVSQLPASLRVRAVER